MAYKDFGFLKQWQIFFLKADLSEEGKQGQDGGTAEEAERRPIKLLKCAFFLKMCLLTRVSLRGKNW